MNKAENNAFIISKLAHKEQTRRDGSPYFHHPLAVSENFITPDMKAIALLHDVLEDCGQQWGGIIEEMCGRHILYAVKILTKQEGQDYFDYINNIALYDDLIAIKKADMRHNLSCTPTEKQKEKYNKAFDLFDKVGRENG